MSQGISASLAGAMNRKRERVQAVGCGFAHVSFECELGSVCPHNVAALAKVVGEDGGNGHDDPVVTGGSIIIKI